MTDRVYEGDGHLVEATHDWLDVQIKVGDGVCFCLRSKNILAIHGQGPIKHASLPQFQIWDGPTKEGARWWLSSRVHRISQIGAPSASLRMVFQEMELFGHPIKRIRRLASCFRRFDFVREPLRPTRIP